MAEATVLALDVGGTSMKAALVARDGEILRRADLQTPVASGPAAIVDALLALAGDLATPDVRAAGIVVPGVVDVAEGVARYSANLGWRDVPLGARLGTALGVPVVVDHDVRAAGLAERALGRARDVADVLVLVIGTGIAGVLISGGTHVRGATDLAGEIGHLPVYPDGEVCACGQRGCTETYASAAAIARRYVAAGGEPLSVPEIVAARPSVPLAERIWTEATGALALAVVSYTMLLDPTRIVLAGGLAEAGAALRDPVRAAVAERLVWRPAPEIAVSPLGGRAGLFGAALLAWRAIGEVDVADWTIR